MTLREKREQRDMVHQFSDEALFDLYNKQGQKHRGNKIDCC